MYLGSVENLHHVSCFCICKNCAAKLSHFFLCLQTMTIIFPVSPIQTSCFLRKLPQTHLIGHANSFLCLEGKKRRHLSFTLIYKIPTKKLNEEGEISETGNALLPSTHLSIQMSAPLRERTCVNIKSSGQDLLEMKETDSTVWEMTHSEIPSLRFKPRVFTVSRTLPRPESSPLRNIDSETDHKTLTLSLTQRLPRSTEHEAI